MATVKESMEKLASVLGGRKENAPVTNDPHYQQLKALVHKAGGKITLRNSDLEDRGGEQNHHDYLYEVKENLLGKLQFRGSRVFDDSHGADDFNYAKLSEKQKETLTADVRALLSSYAYSARQTRKEAILVIQERLLTPGANALTSKESYVIDSFLFYNRSIGGSDSELNKLANEAISQAGHGIPQNRLDDVRKELENFKPEIKYHSDLYNKQDEGLLPNRPYFNEEDITQLQEHEMTLNEAREQAKKYGKLEEFDEMARNGWDEPIAMLANLNLPFIINGQEYRAGHGPFYESSEEMELVDFGGGKAMKEKWTELVSIAKQHATGKGSQTGIKWLEDSFNEFLSISDKVPGWGQGGQTGSQFNREVLAGKIIQHFDGVGSGHELSDKQLSHLKDSLDSIANEKIQNGLKI